MEKDEAIKLAEVDQRARSNTHRIETLEERQDNLDNMLCSISALANEQEHIKTDVKEIKTDVKAMKEKPGRRWEKVVDNAVWLVIGGLLAFVLKQIGL